MTRRTQEFECNREEFSDRKSGVLIALRHESLIDHPILHKKFGLRQDNFLDWVAYFVTRRRARLSVGVRETEENEFIFGVVFVNYEWYEVISWGFLVAGASSCLLSTIFLARKSDSEL